MFGSEDSGLGEGQVAVRPTVPGELVAVVDDSQLSGGPLDDQAPAAAVQALEEQSRGAGLAAELVGCRHTAEGTRCA